MAAFLLLHGAVLTTSAAAPVFFEKEVAPLLAQRSVRCPFGDSSKGGLGLSSAPAASKGGENGRGVAEDGDGCWSLQPLKRLAVPRIPQIVTLAS